MGRSPGSSHAFALPLMHRALPLSEPPDGEHPCCPPLVVVGGARPRRGWRPSAIARLQGFSSCSPAAVPCRRSPRMMTIGLVVGRSKPGCGLCPAFSFKDVHHPRCGGGRAEPGFYLPHGPASCFFLQHSGERALTGLAEGRTSTTLIRSAASVVSCSVPGILAQLALAPPPTLPPAAWSGRGCPSTARATVAPHAGRACLRPFPRRRLHRGIVQDVVHREGGVRVLGLSCPHSGTTPPCGGWRRPVCEDLSGDLPVQAGAAAIRRRGAGAQVAAVVGAEVVAARGGCLRRRDRRRHLRSDLRLFGFDGLSSPLVRGRGRGPFHSSVCSEVIAAAV
jgi:hypothetical protein